MRKIQIDVYMEKFFFPPIFVSGRGEMCMRELHL
jgi:hypothetical protein